MSLIERLRKERISAPPEFPVHPPICDEAATRIALLEEAADFALAVLWGSDSDRNGCVKNLEKVLSRGER